MYQLLQTAFIYTDLTDRVHPQRISAELQTETRTGTRLQWAHRVGTQRTHSLGEYRMVHRTRSTFSQCEARRELRLFRIATSLVHLLPDRSCNITQIGLAFLTSSMYYNTLLPLELLSADTYYSDRQKGARDLTLDYYCVKELTVNQQKPQIKAYLNLF